MTNVNNAMVECSKWQKGPWQMTDKEVQEQQLISGKGCGT